MTPDPDLSPVDALAQLSFLVHGAFERRAGEADLSLSQARLLGILRDREPTMNELGVLIGLDKSSVSGLVDRAERRGMVSRVPSATDRRSVRVRITETGRALIHGGETRFHTDVMALLALVTEEEQRMLVAGATALVAAELRARGVTA